MCFQLSTPSRRRLKNEHNDGFAVVDAPSELKLGYDHPDLPATIRLAADEALLFEWGLIPVWARDREHALSLRGNGRLARAETIFDKPMFRDVVLRQRCLIWVDAFYEWQHRGKKRVPYRIHMPGDAVFAFGGIWNRWRDPADGRERATCALVTVEANELMTEIHNSGRRMPLILPVEQQPAWLDTGLEKAPLQALMQPLPDGLLLAEPVGDEPQRELLLF